MLMFLNPKNWFLSEKEKLKLKAKKHFYGESLERALADIDYPITTDENGKKSNRLAHLAIDEKYGRIDTFTLKMKEAEIVNDDKLELALAQLEIKKSFQKINDIAYEKELKTLHGEPWVSAVSITMNPLKPQEGFIELDWNEQFVDSLRDAGYTGEKPELIVQSWYDSLCIDIAKEYGAVFPEVPKDFEYKNQGRKVKSENGKTEVM